MTVTSNNNAPDLFDFQGQPVRVVSRPDGSHWFVAHDITKALGYQKAGDAVRKLDPEEAATRSVRIRSADGTEQAREVLTVNESGLYSLILTSRRPEAKAFKKWVTAEVLPSLRRHGAFVVGQDSMDLETMTTEELSAFSIAAQARIRAMYEQKEAERAIAHARCLEARKDRDEAHQALRSIMRTSYPTPAGRHALKLPKTSQGPKGRRLGPVIACRRRASKGVI